MNKIQFSIEAYNSGKYDVVTRDGRPVEIKQIYLDAIYPVAGIIEGYDDGSTFMSNGVYSVLLETENDLFLIEKGSYKDVWVNQYLCQFSALNDSKEEADYYAVDSRLSIHHFRLYSNGKLEILETIYPENQ